MNQVHVTAEQVLVVAGIPFEARPNSRVLNTVGSVIEDHFQKPSLTIENKID